MSHISRRALLQGGAAAAGALAFGFHEAVDVKRVFGQDAAGDDVQLIINLAATAETFACVHYYNVLTLGAIQFTDPQIAQLKGALDAELAHLEYLQSNGATALATDFYIPLNLWADLNTFVSVTEQAEAIFNAAYLAAVARFAELGNPLLAATAAQVVAVEAQHLALIREMAGRRGNNVPFLPARYRQVSEAVPNLSGFLEGGVGFEGPSSFPGTDAIRTLVGEDATVPTPPLTDPTVFGVDPVNRTCFILVIGNDVNVRSGPGTDMDIVTTLTENQSISIDGQTVGTDGYTWWRTANATWVRSDVVKTLGVGCGNLPMVTP